MLLHQRLFTNCAFNVTLRKYDDTTALECNAITRVYKGLQFCDKKVSTIIQRRVQFVVVASYRTSVTFV